MLGEARQGAGERAVAERKTPDGGPVPLISILLIEDDPLMRMGLAELIKGQKGLTLISAPEESGGESEAGRGTRPDVVLLDVSTSDPDLLETVRRLHSDDPEAKVILMGAVPRESDVLSLVKEGVAGFLIKGASIDEQTAAIRAVAAGERVLPPALTATLFCQIIDDAKRKGGVPMSDVKMTTREKEIVELIADGLSNKEIGNRLCIATDTVKSHVHNILEKLSLRSRVDVAARARERGSSKN